MIARVSGQPQERSLPVAEGLSLRALLWAAGDGVPFLLVHGLASNARTWQAVGSTLHAEGHPVAAVDLRGHGRSAKPDDGYDFDALTSDLLSAMEILGLDRPVVAGQSTGGNLAVELAYRAPEGVRAVVGVDGGTFELQREWPRWEDCEKALAPPSLEGTPVDEYADTVRREHPDWDEAAVAATVANFEVLADGTIRPWLTRARHLRLLRSLWEHRPSVVVRELKVPLLLVNARNDDALAGLREPAASAGTLAGDHVRVEWVEGDHDLHLHHPRHVARLLRDPALEADAEP